MCEQPELDAEIVVAWHEAALKTARSGRWRGEFLATRLVEGAGALATLLPAGAVPAWARTFTALGSSGRNARPPELSSELIALGVELQQRALALCACISESDPRFASVPEDWILTPESASPRCLLVCYTFQAAWRKRMGTRPTTLM